MTFVILALCIVAGLAIYWWIVRPIMVPLSARIPTGREYKASLTHRRTNNERSQGRRMPG